ncbi:MAG: leucine-rich repeat domain-containing protein [Clostridia bacterium]|nr:leucine-rich repeat domain-containing protein [Clostridia bacterium]
MDNEKLIKQLSQEGKKVPDNRKKIINAAKAEGLLTDNSPKPAAVYNGGGTASAVKGNRIIAAVASVFVLGTVAAAAIVPFVAGNNGAPSIPNLPSIPSSPILCTEKLGTDYAIGAVSTAKLLSSFGIASAENNGATATPSSLKREAFVEQELNVETQINNFGTYFGAFGTFFGEGEELVAVSDAPVKNEKYPNSIVIAGKYANGEDAEYAMYYLEALDIENSTDSEEIYYLEGEIFIDKVSYYLEGSRTFLTTDDGAEAYDLVLRAYPDAKNRGDYVQMTMGYREVNDSYTKSYDYKVFKDGNWLTQTLTYLPSFEREEAFNLYCGYGDSEARFTFYRPEENKPIIKVGYEIGTKRSSFKVSQTKSQAFTILMNNFMYDLKDSDKTCTIRGYKASEALTDETLEIPEEIVVKNDIYTVTGIGASAFFGRDELKKLIIPSTVKTIGASAFGYSDNIEEVEFNEGLISIGDRAFYLCGSLKNIAIPASVTDISNDAFKYCASLETISVAAGNTAFSGAGNCLVNKYGALIQGCATSVIPDDGTINEIRAYAFSRTKIKSINIPASVSFIDESAFESCKELEEAVISEGVKMLGFQTFAYCEKLTKITLPDTDIQISENVFFDTGYSNDISNWNMEYGYEALYIGRHLIYLNSTTMDFAPDVNVRAGTLTIANSAFACDKFGFNDTLIGTVTLNRELLRIGYATRMGAFGCRSISFEGGVNANENGNYYIDGNCLIDNETFAIIAGCDGSIIPDDYKISTIYDYAFAGCKFSTINIPKNIGKIGHFAFGGCIYLQEIVIPASVWDINFNAFWNCSSLKEVVFEERDDENESYPYAGLNLWECFTYCSSLESIVLPKHVSGLNYVFENCNKLSSITINYDSEYHLQINNLVFGCENVKVVNFTGTAEQWKSCYKGDIDFMPFTVYCAGDDTYLTPDYHE